jgi:hypothetical protein
VTKKQIISLVVGLGLGSVMLLVVLRDKGDIQDSVGPASDTAGSLERVEQDASAAGFQILSESSTETDRVYVVSRNGQVRTSTVPAFVQFTPEQLEEFSFGTPEADGPPAPQGRVGLHRHLVFYGIALDGETNAVADAFVDTIIQVSDERGQRAVTNRITSGADGRFTVEQPWGQLLMITVSKPTNYVAAPPQWFQYGPVGGRPIHVPLPRDPVPFFLHKVQTPESLLEISRWWGIPNSGEPVRIDLITGQKVVSGGDLIVSIHCPEPFKAGDQIPWRLSVEVVGGGLVPATENRLEQLHRAPAGGYLPVLTVEHSRNDPDWDSQFEGLYFLSSRQGQIFAKLRTRMHVQWDERGVPFGIQGFLNTNGSRNLQTYVR